MANEEMPTQESTLIESSVLDQGLAKFYLSDTFSDVKLVLSDQDIHAHKIVLATKSKYFKSLLLKDPKQTELNLTDVRSKAFRKVLRFIYTGSIVITTSDEDLMFDILKLSSKYCLETLEESVLVQVSSMLNMTNVCQILNEANSCDIDKLRDICHGFIDERIEDVIESDFFNALSEKSIIRLLERDAFSAPEIDIFKIIARWCQANGNKGNLVSKVVRFPYLTEDEIVKVVFPSELVDNKDLLYVLKSMKDGTIYVEDLKDAQRNSSILMDIARAQKMLGVSDRHLFKTFDPNVFETKKSDLNATDICSILNTANFYDTDSLCILCYSFIILNLDKFVWEDCFLNLTKKSLIGLLQWEEFYMPEIDIFKNVLKWCQTNNDFDKKLIECVHLNLIELRDLLPRIVDCEELLPAMSEIVSVKSTTSRGRGLKLIDQNIATSDLKAQVISGNKQSDLLQANRNINKCCSHTIGDQDGIVIKLFRPLHFNHIEMKLKDSDSMGVFQFLRKKKLKRTRNNLRYYKYYIEISLDQKNWRTIIDYRSFPCRSVQKLFFETQIAQYIKIVGTSVGLESESKFELVYFEAYLKSLVPRFIKGIVCPKSNVATVEDGAIVLQGEFRYGSNFSQICSEINDESIIIQLAQPYMISRIKFMLRSTEWKYLIETSVDKTHWEIAVDRANTNCSGWQDLRFKERPVVFIKIKNCDVVTIFFPFVRFCCDQLECFFESN